MYRNDLNDDYIENRNPIYPGAEGIYRLPDYIPSISNILDFFQDGLASLVDNLFFGGLDDDDPRDPRRRPPRRDPRRRPPRRDPRKDPRRRPPRRHPRR